MLTTMTYGESLFGCVSDESQADKTFNKIWDMPYKTLMVFQSEVAGFCDSTITFDHILDYAVFKNL
jgi:hypothetical protein